MIGWRPGQDRSREFEAVALVHLDALYRSALRLTQNRAEAEDVVEDTFLRAFRSFHRFNPGTNCRAWLFTILRNTFLNRVRGAGREVHEGDSAEGWDALLERSAERRPGAGNPEEELLQTALHGDVDRALRALPLAFREAVVLVDLEGSAERRPGAGNPEEELLQTALHGDVDRALRALPLAFREAVVLVDLE